MANSQSDIMLLRLNQLHASLQRYLTFAFCQYLFVEHERASSSHGQKRCESYSWLPVQYKWAYSSQVDLTWLMLGFTDIRTLSILKHASGANKKYVSFIEWMQCASSLYRLLFNPPNYSAKLALSPFTCENPKLSAVKDLIKAK